jgi:hypothetical protein
MTERSVVRVALTGLVLSVACSSRPNVDQVPVGQDVQITKEDGGVVDGKLADKNAQTVTVDTGHGTRAIPRTAIADVQIVGQQTPVTLPPAAKFREYTIPEGTAVAIRLDAPISSATNHVEDPVEGELAEAVKVDAAVVLPAGSAVRGVVTDAQPSGKVKGLARLAVAFRSVAAADRPDRYDITAHWAREAQATKGEDAKKIGIGAGAGAAIGAIVGGGKGAAIGSAIGGGAGTAAVMSTSGKEVTLDRGDVLRVTLAKDVDVKVPITPKGQ